MCCACGGGSSTLVGNQVYNSNAEPTELVSEYRRGDSLGDIVPAERPNSYSGIDGTWYITYALVNRIVYVDSPGSRDGIYDCLVTTHNMVAQW